MIGEITQIICLLVLQLAIRAGVYRKLDSMKCVVAGIVS